MKPIEYNSGDDVNLNSDEKLYQFIFNDLNNKLIAQTLHEKIVRYGLISVVLLFTLLTLILVFLRPCQIICYELCLCKRNWEILSNWYVYGHNGAYYVFKHLCVKKGYLSPAYPNFMQWYKDDKQQEIKRKKKKLKLLRKKYKQQRYSSIKQLKIKRKGSLNIDRMMEEALLGEEAILTV
ncbi:unnamed protein product [Didymodactylos carnosus]|uniref:Uncharacterized protein n=1 Tax=Didymodactylos carnosus TaxID=1234261 RepID=A0A813QHG3_9BILA|nr:unnamed protein product [Didymodactylos carnosus]CAF0868322.1 unnamed protein product [Didymodactylos carnosus]CAF3549865.1 unnamed protein product [Didymodactylos carnosus]CAF3653137.1 unnamed protein product [Didymodactylos carnosus]